MTPVTVVYKSHHNGDMRINNVPFIKMRKGRAASSEDYISSEVLQNLAVIYKYMEEHHLTEMDYRQFVSIWNFEKQREEEPAEEPSKNYDPKNQKAIIDYVRTEWLNKYHQWKWQANSANPEVMKLAKGKIKLLEDKVNQLSELHQEIIKLKFLEVNEFGEFPLDDFVYQTLHISRAYYYIQKKKALYLLGLSLLQQNE